MLSEKPVLTANAISSVMGSAMPAKALKYRQVLHDLPKVTGRQWTMWDIEPRPDSTLLHHAHPSVSSF